jgi:hypothetical protein
LKGEGDDMIAPLFRSNRLPECSQLRGALEIWLLEGLDGEDHIFSGERFPIVPTHTRAEIEGIGEAILGDIPLLSQIRHYFSPFVDLGKAREDEGDEITVHLVVAAQERVEIGRATRHPFYIGTTFGGDDKGSGRVG